jgi:hypothetical protein
MTADADRLFREYHGTLVRYLTRRLGDRDWAEEVAQETFVRAGPISRGSRCRCGSRDRRRRGEEDRIRARGNVGAP